MNKPNIHADKNKNKNKLLFPVAAIAVITLALVATHPVEMNNVLAQRPAGGPAAGPGGAGPGAQGQALGSICPIVDIWVMLDFDAGIFEDDQYKDPIGPGPTYPDVQLVWDENQERCKAPPLSPNCSSLSPGYECIANNVRCSTPLAGWNNDLNRCSRPGAAGVAVAP